MCGFVGIVGRKKINLEESANLIFHRGLAQMQTTSLNIKKIIQ